MKKKATGFTITEILVVLGIIFILAVLLVSAAFSARDNAATKNCMAFMKTISMAFSLYLQDYDGTYPAVSTTLFKPIKDNTDKPRDTRGEGGQSWSEVLMPYMRTTSSQYIPTCPSTDRSAVSESESWYLRMGYAYNINLSETTFGTIEKTKLAQGRPDYQLHYESMTVVLAESRLGIYGLAMPDARKLDNLDVIYQRSLEKAINEQPFGATRHHGGANYAFADGHMKWLKPDQLNVDEKCDGKTPGFGL